MTPAPQVAFIVPAWNEAACLPATLQALRDACRAVGLHAECVVVDDGSTDDTAVLAVAGGARLLQVTHRQIAATRNAGAAASLAPRLVFVDADTRVDAALLRAAMGALASGAVGGGCRVRLDGPRRWPLRMGVWLVGQAFRYTGIAPGCFLFCTREAFDAVGGFDTTLFAGEDVAMSRALARHGRFVILREAVQTSGRKLAHASTWMQMRLLWRFARQGTRMLRSRDELALWYGGPEGRAPR